MEAPRCSLTQLVAYFLRLGATGFGGPIALAGDMQRDLVERRGWIAKEDYLEGLALAQLSPGPLAAQLAMYIGWVRGGPMGAALVGTAFVLPSLAMVLLLAVLYVRFGSLVWMRSAFYGVGAAVIAIIARSAVKLARMTLAREGLLWGVFAISAVVTAVSESELVVLFIAFGLATMLVRMFPRWAARPSGQIIGPRDNGSSAPTGVRPARPPSTPDEPDQLRAVLLAPALGGGVHLASWTTIAQVAWLFTKAGAFVFGSGLAIVPFLYQGAVVEHRWLDEQQFRDAVAVAMITPGPVVITAAFIGYLAAGWAGALVAVGGTFVPPFLVVALAAGAMKRAARLAPLRAFLAGVTASATGAIAGAAFILGRRAIIDAPTLLIALGASGALLLPKRVPEPMLIVAAGVAGFLLEGHP